MATSDKKKDLQNTEANTCLALGAGVGALGAAGAVLTGAVCPLCIFVAPGLLGLGAYKKIKSRKTTETQASEEP